MADPMDRARTSAAVTIELLKKLEALSLPILDEMARLLHGTDHPLEPVLEGAAKSALRTAFGAKAKTLSELVLAGPSGPSATHALPRENLLTCST